ncbi:c-type cytochrome, partial [bacterium]|nr:c-type cytochrome [bacterium]
MTDRIAILLALLSTTALAAPDRESFAKEDRLVEGVPVGAFDVSDPNLQIEVWAQSPMIYSPVAMDTDAQGRLWLTEGLDYSVGRRVDAGQSIIVLEDKNQDGKADSSHVFVTEKGLRHAPLGIAVFDNRIVLSATPSIIVYTDVDRNAVFDPKIDKREIFLTGFKNDRHDHTLHAVVGAPSGQWHFSYGNCGADIRTKDGRHYISGCYYGFPEAIGKKSSDGHVYPGGLTMRINPDGTGLTPTASNMRNPHDMFVTAFGDVLQSDNDDPAHCRSSWVMEHGNFGYSDLRDGSRSWEEVAKSWEEPTGWSRDLRFSRSHWRENYPGACPPGSIYGAGSPTGNLFIEDDTLGLKGTYLVCDMVRKQVMACLPQLTEAQIEMGRHQDFIQLEKGEKGQHFLPTDVILGTDGSLFLSDFYNNTSRRTNQVSGTIYRVTRKGAAPLKRPTNDFSTVAGQLAALDNPAVNVRSHAAHLLVKKGDLQRVLASLKKSTTPESLSRHLWIIAQLGPDGEAAVAPYLNHADLNIQIASFRALRHAKPNGLVTLASKALPLSKANLSLAREIAVSLRDVPFAKAKPLLQELIAKYDGRNRYFLEALGIAFTGKEREVYRELIRPLFGDPKSWSKTARNLAWRLHTPDAIPDLDQTIRAQSPPVDEFRHLAMAFASFRNDADRSDRVKRLTAFAKLPAFSDEAYQITVQEIIAKDLNDLEALPLKGDYKVPKAFGQITELSDSVTVAKLKGDATRGEALAATCLTCHKINGNGIAFGPNLSRWGQERTIEKIAHEIINPDEHLAHGYEQAVRLTGSGHTAEGLLSNFSWHAGSLKIKVMGGTTLKVPFRRTGTKIEHLKESWMPSASEMGLSDQGVRDIAEYLHTLKFPVVSKKDDGAPGDTQASGWQVLEGEDFVNVNCHDDTWVWKGGHAFCNGKPTGVIRYHEPLKNFEFSCEWMHKKKGGNSGVFVWATPASINRLAAGQGRLPHGIEVQ